MTAALLWKEYRQQRSLWLAMVVVAGLLVTSIASVLGLPGGWDAPDLNLQSLLNGVLLCLAAIYGVVSGALLLAGEKEEGTLPFLDNLMGQRRPLWSRKLLAGVCLTLSQAVAMVGVASALGFASWERAIVLTALTLNALAWGMLTGALWRNVLLAALVGIALTAFAQLLPVAMQEFAGRIVVLETRGWRRCRICIVAHLLPR